MRRPSVKLNNLISKNQTHSVKFKLRPLNTRSIGAQFSQRTYILITLNVVISGDKIFKKIIVTFSQNKKYFLEKLVLFQQKFKVNFTFVFVF